MKRRTHRLTRHFGRRQALTLISTGVGLATLTHGRAARAAAYSAASDSPADVAVDWFDLLLELTRSTSGCSPPVAARAFAYAGIALYESLVPGMHGYRSLANALDGFPAMPPAPGLHHWGLVANSALAHMSLALYPDTSAANKAAIIELWSDYAAFFAKNTSPGVFHKSFARGLVVANRIFAWSKGDGGHHGHTRNVDPDYVPPTGPGLWVPTPGDFAPALQPHWGRNRAFVLGDNDRFDPGPPPAFSSEPSSTFFQEALAVYEAVQNITPAEREIAQFWSDDPGTTSTPPGHSISIASQLIEQEQMPLDFAAEAYLKVGIAVSDAFVSCWTTKFKYNLLRPITYIRTYIDPSWTPVLPTPPFPEHTSGHSVQSGATAEVLEALFGSLAFTDRTHEDRGFAPRPFPSFEAFAQEAALSRLYGGIHFMPAIVDGVTQGRKVGALVNALPIYA